MCSLPVMQLPCKYSLDQRAFYSELYQSPSPFQPVMSPKAFDSATMLEALWNVRPVGCAAHSPSPRHPHSAPVLVHAYIITDSDYTHTFMPEFLLSLISECCMHRKV